MIPIHLPVNMAKSLPVIEKIKDLKEIDANTFPLVFYESLESVFRYSLADIKETLDKQDSGTLLATSNLLSKHVVDMLPDLCETQSTRW